jgi:hypothetical protein
MLKENYKDDVDARIENTEKDTSTLELAEEIFSCLDMLYSNDSGNKPKFLPDVLSEYSGIIHVAYKQSKLLINKLKEEKTI